MGATGGNIGGARALATMRVASMALTDTAIRKAKFGEKTPRLFDGSGSIWSFHRPGVSGGA